MYESVGKIVFFMDVQKGLNLTISSRRILRPYQFYFIKRKARRLTDSRYEIGVPLVNGRYTKRTTFSAKKWYIKR